MTEREVLKLALEALETVRHKIDSYQVNVCDDVDEAITAIREALAQPEFTKHEVENADDWSEWVCPDPKSYLMKCCDCGLVHEAQFKVVRYKSEDEREECDTVDDPNVQAVFRMRRSEEWTPKDTAYRPGGLAQPEPSAYWHSEFLKYNTTSDHRMMENAQGELERIKLVQTGVGIGKPNGCQCPACKIAPHESDCPVHNEPAWPNGPCDCGAQPEQEPVAWRWGVQKLKNGDFEWRYSLNQTRPDAIPLYTTPPQSEPVIDKSAAIRIATSLGWEPKRTWSGLTEEEQQELYDAWMQKDDGLGSFYTLIEAKLRSKNT